MIPYGRQEVTEADIDAVVDVLRSEYLTEGSVVPRFEQAVAGYCGAAHGVAANSATSALHLACLALDLGPGDWLWTSPITFVASANCGLYCGARVDFVDIDPCTYNLSPDALAEKLAVAEREGCLPKVVVPVHLCGQSCDMAAIHEMSQRYRFRIIEDASHAIGGRYQGEPIGCGQYSDVTVFSFHPVKIITTGEGGMAVTNHTELADRMDRLRSHGITRDPALMTHEADGPWYYQQIELGFNYRITDIQAALGLSQLDRLDDYLMRRRKLAARYDDRLAELPVTTPWQHPNSESAWHLYVIRLQTDKCQVSHCDVFDSLRSEDVGVNLHYIPIHTQPFYQGLGFELGAFPAAEQYYREAVSLPLYPTMKEATQDEVVAAVRSGVVA